MIWPIFCVLLIGLCSSEQGFNATMKPSFHYISITNATEQTPANVSAPLAPGIMAPLNISGDSTFKTDSFPSLDKKGNSTICTKKHNHTEDELLVDNNEKELQNGSYSVRIAAIPILILLIFLVIACVVANRRKCTLAEQFPILTKLCPLQPISDNENAHPPLNCVDRLTNHNFQFVHFMKALTNPLAPTPRVPYRCDCRQCIRKQRLLRASLSSESSQPISYPNAFLSATVFFKKGDEQVEIHGLSSSDNQSSESVDTESSSVAMSSSVFSSDDSDSSSGRMTKKERKAFNQEGNECDDNSSISDLNPFDPEYVYAALAPDMQHPSFDNFAEEKETPNHIVTIQPRKNQYQQSTFVQPTLLDTIQE